MVDVASVYEICERADTIRAALTCLQGQLNADRVGMLFYGFFLNGGARARNDYLWAHTGPDDPDVLRQTFQDIGGTATDVTALNLETFDEPFFMDVAAHRDAQIAQNNPRARTWEVVLSFGFQSIWIIPLKGRTTGGLGLLDLFCFDRDPTPPIPSADMSALAAHLHPALRAGGLLAGEKNVTRLQALTLQRLAEGKTAFDIADEFDVTERAIEKRVEKARRALGARNAVETVYKATVYGVLPADAAQRRKA